MSPNRPHPKVTSRRQAVSASRWRKRFQVLGICLGVSAIFAGLAYLLQTSTFRVQDVEVSGALHTPTAEIVAASQLADHPTMVLLDSAAVAQGIERLAWIEQVDVQRHWPHKVTLVVHERNPVAAIMRKDGSFVLADQSGRLLQNVTDPGGLPSVARVQSVGKPGSSVGAPSLAALKVAARLPVAFKAQVIGVDVTAKGNVRLRLSSPVAVQFGQAVHLPAKFAALAAVLAGAPLHPGDVVDVSVPSTPVVKGP
ncbi:MAG: FtsQ-type POTRA domain-containing protein [Actinobacteria bacterium]|nr:FtsQ-type POTRA domain-containing protein [Actinomycetota bacterium]